MTPPNFVISVRSVERRKGREPAFGNDPGPTRYLLVPDGETPHPERHRLAASEWLKLVVEEAEVGLRPVEPDSPVAGYAFGDVLIFVHGYNNSQDAVMHRHNLLQKRLGEHGYKGAIVSFDWPSATSTLNYLEDRSDARATAERLVHDGIAVLARNQLAQDRNRCDIDVHLLGHSTGAYVIRESFYIAEQNRSISRVNWMVSQVAFIGGDIARSSLAASDSKSGSLFRHALRITNYQNAHDSALQMSNAKRVGIAPRVGRVGVPEGAPGSVVNVDCSAHWRTLDEQASAAEGNWSHSWHFDDPVFAEDLFLTILGHDDRNVLPTRTLDGGRLALRVPDRP
ncbi:MAG: alpha/beta fold hydrolase [Rhodospirillales bacterium]